MLKHILFFCNKHEMKNCCDKKIEINNTVSTMKSYNLLCPILRNINLFIIQFCEEMSPL